MILKKPYAFIIKHFRLINIVLAALICYLAYRSSSIVTFFNEYVSSSYSNVFYEGFAETYIDAMLYICIVFIIAGLLVIYLLFKYKNKPTKVYLATIIYYVIFFIVCSYLGGILKTLETDVISAETARNIRDISLILFIPQIYFAISYLLKGLGFNIKKLNFDQDLKDLEIEQHDNEEVEITIGKDNYKIFRYFRRFFREFGYYYQENRVIFLAIGGIIGFIILFAGIKTIPEMFKDKHGQGDDFAIKNIVYNVKDSIVTNMDYRGEALDSFYLVIKLNMRNIASGEAFIDQNDYRLELKKRYAYTYKGTNSNFMDYGNINIVKKMAGKEEGTYLLVFKLKEDEIYNTYTLKINSGTGIVDDMLMGKYKNITVTPSKVTKVVNAGNYSLGKDVSLVNSYLKNTKLKFTDLVIDDKYIYDYTFEGKEYKGMVNVDYTINNKTLMVLGYEYIIDENVPYNTYSKSITTFMNTFAKIKYKVGEEYKYSSVKVVNPTNLESKVVLEVDKKVKESEEVYVILTIRDKEYNIRVK